MAGSDPPSRSGVTYLVALTVLSFILVRCVKRLYDGHYYTSVFLIVLLPMALIETFLALRMGVEKVDKQICEL